MMMVCQVPYAGRAAQSVRAWLTAWLKDQPGVTEETFVRILQCASELVTNSFVHAKPAGPDDRITVCLDINNRRVRVDVLDAGSADKAPHVEETFGDDTNVHGRGLLIVRVMATAWGVAPGVGTLAGSNVAWFIVNLVDDLADDPTSETPRALLDDKLTLTLSLQPLGEVTQ